MLRDLKIPGRSKSLDIGSVRSEKDAEIASNLVDVLYRYVLDSIQNNRSSVKINAFTRGMIGGVISRTRDGTKEYINGMPDDLISLLLDDFEKELMKRKVKR